MTQKREEQVRPEFIRIKNCRFKVDEITAYNLSSDKKREDKFHHRLKVELQKDNVYTIYFPKEGNTEAVDAINGLDKVLDVRDLNPIIHSYF